MSRLGRRNQITLFGNFGSGNFGNEATLVAMLSHLRKHLPDAEISCICPGPEATAARHQILAFPMKENPLAPSRGRMAKRWRVLRKLVLGVPLELYRWIAAFRRL